MPRPHPHTHERDESVVRGVAWLPWVSPSPSLHLGTSSPTTHHPFRFNGPPAPKRKRWVRITRIPDGLLVTVVLLPIAKLLPVFFFPLSSVRPQPEQREQAKKKPYSFSSCFNHRTFELQLVGHSFL